MYEIQPWPETAEACPETIHCLLYYFINIAGVLTILFFGGSSVAK